jgi:hypothetical protein
MNPEDKSVSRRKFLAAAALGGLMTGAVARAQEKKPADKKDEKKDDKKEEKGKNDPANILVDNHVCRGINTCKTKGKGGDNACAGQGKCAIATAHGCHAKNDCKGQGGCGGHPGENSCKGTGACAVPLKEKTWATARKTYEAAMKKAGKKFGAAPKAG